MKKIIFLFLAAGLPCFAQVAASNVVADVCAYTGRVVTVQGVVESVKRDGLSSSSYVVAMQGLSVRVFFDANSKAFSKNGHLQRSSFDNISKPSCGSFVLYTGLVKFEMGKPFLITEKK